MLELNRNTQISESPQQCRSGWRLPIRLPTARRASGGTYRPFATDTRSEPLQRSQDPPRQRRVPDYGGVQLPARNPRQLSERWQRFSQVVCYKNLPRHFFNPRLTVLRHSLTYYRPQFRRTKAPDSANKLHRQLSSRWQPRHTR